MPDKPDITKEDENALQAVDAEGEADAEAVSADPPVSGTGAETPAVDADQLRRERDDYYDRLLRKTAEFENYRKRVDKERRETVQYATGDLIEALLPIIDDFERALGADASADPEAYRRGIELIYKQLQDLLARRGATRIEAVGKDFDPRYHQAITHEASPGRRDGEVIEEVRRGYMLGDRLLRPAMVKVAKA